MTFGFPLRKVLFAFLQHFLRPLSYYLELLGESSYDINEWTFIQTVWVSNEDVFMPI